MATPNYSGDMNFADAPGADLTLDELFAPEGLSENTPQATSATEQPAQATQSSAAPATETFFLRAPNGTVYKTEQDAIQGTVQKDQLIADMRQKLSEVTGVDPITNRPVQRQTPPQVQSQPETNYLQSPDKFWDDASEAIKRNDKTAWAQTFQKFVADTLSPVAPVFTDLAKRDAIERIAVEVPEIRTFVNSPDYQAVLDSRPQLKAAIQASESNFAYVNNLPELYRFAYNENQVRKIPDLIRAQVELSRSTAPVVQNPQPTRPTTQSPSTMAPPPPGPQVPETDLWRTSEGRKVLIDRAKANGALDHKF